MQNKKFKIYGYVVEADDEFTNKHWHSSVFDERNSGDDALLLAEDHTKNLLYMKNVKVTTLIDEAEAASKLEKLTKALENLTDFIANPKYDNALDVRMQLLAEAETLLNEMR